MPSLEEVPFSTTIEASPYRARATRPSAPLKEASRLLLDVASTPPMSMSGGEWRARFIHTCISRTYQNSFTCFATPSSKEGPGAATTPEGQVVGALSSLVKCELAVVRCAMYLLATDPM
jgi:hypothetical protein